MNGPRIALCLAIAVCCRAPSVAAHDFWVQPNRYWTLPDVPTPFTLQVGHGPFRQRSPIAAQRISRFQAISPQWRITQLRERLRPGDGPQDGDFRLPSPGTYILVLQTDNQAQTQLPSIRFNDYLKAEGLTPALEQRQRQHRMAADGSERYSRCAKAIVQVGAPDSVSSAQLSRPVGLPLEIVPEANPYALPRATRLPVRVLYNGVALPGALVKLTDLRNDASPFESHVTDPQGRAVFKMPATGSWLLNVIWTKSLPPSADTDFETVFSSLSFGYPTSLP